MSVVGLAGMTLVLDAELDERRILLERRAEEHLARQEHDDEFRRRLERAAK